MSAVRGVRRWLVVLSVVGCCGAPGVARAAVLPPPPSRDVRLIPLDQGTLPVGINDTSFDAGQATPSQIAAQNHDLGSGVVRFTIPWKYAESTQGKYDWSRWDPLVTALRANGLRPLPVITFAPSWAAPVKFAQCQRNPNLAGCSPQFRSPPEPLFDADWQNFAGAVAAHYPTSVGIEIWNEPNLASFWGGTPDPTRYVQILQRAYAGIKAAVPTMPVVGGALNNNMSDAAPNVSIGTFTQRMLDLGGANSMDAFSFHPYPDSTNVTGASSDFTRSFNAVRPILRSKGLEGHLRLWLTETGSSTTGASPNGGLSQAQQAQVTTDLYDASRAMSDVDLVAFHTMVDRCATASDFNCGFGLLGLPQNGVFPTKQAYVALQSHLTALRSP